MFLNEEPDHIEKNGKIHSWYDEDAIAFAVKNGKAYMCGSGLIPIRKKEFAPFAKRNGNHERLPKLYDGVDEFSTIHGKRYPVISGRVWVKSKLISFWSYPKTNREMMNVLRSINDEHERLTGRRLKFSNYEIEIIEDREGDVNWYNDHAAYNTAYVKPKNYKSSRTRSEKDLAKIHTLPPEEKAAMRKQLGIKPRSKKKVTNMPMAKYNFLRRKGLGEGIYRKGNRINENENMKLTERKLRRIIREEINSLTEAGDEWGIYADDRLGSKYLYDGPFDSERDAKIEINRLMYNSPLSVREAGNLYVEPYDPRYKKVHGRWAIYEKAPSGNGKSMVDGPFKSKKEAERGINRLKYNSPIPMHEVVKFWVGPYDPRYDV